MKKKLGKLKFNKKIIANANAVQKGRIMGGEESTVIICVGDEDRFTDYCGPSKVYNSCAVTCTGDTSVIYPKCHTFLCF